MMADPFVWSSYTSIFQRVTYAVGSSCKHRHGSKAAEPTNEPNVQRQKGRHYTSVSHCSTQNAQLQRWPVEHAMPPNFQTVASRCCISMLHSNGCQLVLTHSTDPCTAHAPHTYLTYDIHATSAVGCALPNMCHAQAVHCFNRAWCTRGAQAFASHPGRPAHKHAAEQPRVLGLTEQPCNLKGKES